ncbi:hypothetical protein [Yersinia phage fHe-Yen9-04]|uniref:Uncharacterized protein n=1 Tax=Yersinia phage fHe-Yen9-04 TaxID=2052742 RepID=A0A2C9CZ23_9CAUD|nr:hypothetical protein FDJ41_gp341 [Yersinia phage fHe-Yen9-04]SOK58618.1 hypothetical protein [Yersinia phage fHe-Yen9-04]VUE36387.1 hypothetical protein [Yersinia phage fHe-Yen9-04]
MIKLIPFNIWYNDLEELISVINNSNLEVLKYAKSYNFDTFAFCMPENELFQFSIKKPAEQFQQTAIGINGILNPSPYLLYYSVTVSFTKNFIVKLEVVEHWKSQITSYEKHTIHSVIFDKEHMLINGNWYKVDSPEPFIYDLKDEDISILAIIDIMERFNPQ